MKKKTGFRDIWMIWDKPKKNEDKKKDQERRWIKITPY